MTASLEGSQTKAKEAPSPHEVRLALLDTNPVFQSLGGLCQSILEMKIISQLHGLALFTIPLK